ncbi:unnamed protein product, partial [Symbiodinium necroappetens]
MAADGQRLGRWPLVPPLQCRLELLWLHWREGPVGTSQS